MSIYTKDNLPELWYRPLSRHAVALRILSPMDDERGSMGDALQRNDTARIKYLKTSLPTAVATMDDELTQKLLRFNADPNARCRDRRTALHLAVSSSRMSLVQDLVAIKADIHAYDAEGRSTLHWAAESSHLEACAFLIGQKADVNAQTHRHRWTPLHYACRGSLVIKHVEDSARKGTNIRRSNYMTNLPLAVLLILNKADINLESTSGAGVEREGAQNNTPLDLVQDGDHKQALLAIEEVVHAEGAKMARGCSTQYASNFWDNLCDALRFCRVVLPHDDNGSVSLSQLEPVTAYPIASKKHLDVDVVVGRLVHAGADPELLLLSVVDSGGQIDEEFMLQCVDVLRGKFGAQGLVAPSNDHVCDGDGDGGGGGDDFDVDSDDAYLQ